MRLPVLLEILYSMAGLITFTCEAFPSKKLLDVATSLTRKVFIFFITFSDAAEYVFLMPMECLPNVVTFLSLLFKKIFNTQEFKKFSEKEHLEGQEHMFIVISLW